MGLAGGVLLAVVAHVGGWIKSSPLKAALMIGGIAWLVLYVVPMGKYPPSPEAIFAPGDAVTYQSLLAGYTAVSGLAAIGITLGFQNIRRKEKVFGAAALYLAIVTAVFSHFLTMRMRKWLSYQGHCLAHGDQLFQYL
jgi:hypothetical protein